MTFINVLNHSNIEIKEEGIRRRMIDFNELYCIEHDEHMYHLGIFNNYLI